MLGTTNTTHVANINHVARVALTLSPNSFVESNAALFRGNISAANLNQISGAEGFGEEVIELYKKRVGAVADGEDVA